MIRLHTMGNIVCLRLGADVRVFEDGYLPNPKHFFFLRAINTIVRKKAKTKTKNKIKLKFS